MRPGPASPAQPPLFENGALTTVARVRDRAAVCICNFILAGKFVLMDMDPDGKVAELGANFCDLKISHFFSMDFNTGAMFLHGMRFGLDGECGGQLPNSALQHCPTCRRPSASLCCCPSKG